GVARGLWGAGDGGEENERRGGGGRREPPPPVEEDGGERDRGEDRDDLQGHAQTEVARVHADLGQRPGARRGAGSDRERRERRALDKRRQARARAQPVEPHRGERREREDPQEDE